jgi:hypothetical protein
MTYINDLQKNLEYPVTLHFPESGEILIYASKYDFQHSKIWVYIDTRTETLDLRLYSKPPASDQIEIFDKNGKTIDYCASQTSSFLMGHKTIISYYYTNPVQIKPERLREILTTYLQNQTDYEGLPNNPTIKDLLEYACHYAQGYRT